MAADVPQRGETRADERQVADVKACDPGAPMLAPSLVTVPKASREVTGARQPIPGEIAYKR